MYFGMSMHMQNVVTAAPQAHVIEVFKQHKLINDCTVRLRKLCTKSVLWKTNNRCQCAL